ncbi:hypothetical protein V6N13_147279 [Hibiscus sabdariffa]
MKLSSFDLFFVVEVFGLIADGGDKGEDELRGMREKGEEISGRHERGDPSGSEPQAKQAHGGRLLLLPKNITNP